MRSPHWDAALFRRVGQVSRKAPFSFVMLLFRPHISARLVLDGLAWNLILENDIEICRASLVKIGQIFRPVYLQSYAYLYCWQWHNQHIIDLFEPEGFRLLGQPRGCTHYKIFCTSTTTLMKTHCWLSMATDVNTNAPHCYMIRNFSTFLKEISSIYETRFFMPIF